ncbi:MAG: PilZ domain-containing protein [Candidatus Omnitrophota bacterium]|nr:PilZ domain-containing protein [Candidatus Omnitrophota bacterium]
MKQKKKKIGQILLERGFITRDMLNEALRCQSVSGGAITEYLFNAKYIQEEDLAKCITDQLGFPYLSLETYDIPEEIIKLIPVDIAAKYLLIPIDKMENVITVVMVDPLDVDVIEHAERLTGCRIQPFVGIISDIRRALKRYYNVAMEDKIFERKGPTPISITADKYNSFERRRSVRLKAKIDVHFPVQDYYKNSKTKDISLHGLLFVSEKALPVNSYVTIQIDLSKEISPIPIAVVARIARVMPLSENKFDIGAEIIKIREEDAYTINKYAMAHQINQGNSS